jgi:hypothetical protein
MADATRTIETILTAKNTTGGAWKSAEAGGKRFFTRMTAGAKVAATAFLNMRNIIAGGIIAGAIKKLTDSGDEIDKLSQRIGVTAREFQVLRHAMELGGGSAGSLEQAFKGAARIIFDMQNGSVEAERALNALGVTLEDLEGKTQMEQFNILFRSLGRVEDATLKLALAQQLFGRSGQTLLPILNATGGNLDELADKMERNGQLLSDEQIKKSAEFKDSLTELNRAIQGALFDALGDAIGRLTQSLNALVESGTLAELTAQLKVVTDAATMGAIGLYTFDQAARKFLKGLVVGDPLGGLKAAFEELDALLDKTDARLRGRTAAATGTTGTTGATPSPGDELGALGTNEAKVRAFTATEEEESDGSKQLRADIIALGAAGKKVADAHAALELETAKQYVQSTADGEAMKARARADAHQTNLDDLRQAQGDLDQAARDSAKAANAAWDAILNPETTAERRAAHDAEREQAKLDRALGKARAKQADGRRLTKPQRALLAADDMQQAADLDQQAADIGRQKAADEGALLAQANLDLQTAQTAQTAALTTNTSALVALQTALAGKQQDLATLDPAAALAIGTVPPMAAAPATAGPDLAAILTSIDAHAAAMAQHGIM